MSHNASLAPALRWSGALRRKANAHPEFESWLEQAAHSPVDPARIDHWFSELAQVAPDDPAAIPADTLRRALRQTRTRVFHTLMVRDLNRLAPLSEVVSAMSHFADLAVGQAYRTVATDLAATHGIPLDPATGTPQEMIIIGMGKLGGRELNVSSDIDLIMLYGEEGETDGRRRLSHHEFYGRVTRNMMPVLSEPDANGQVFRTDLRLRPDGDAGPLAWSLDALENYLVTQGREWERYAWLKGRVIPASAFSGSAMSVQLAQLESLRRPFVYRKYFDFDALAALRALRERIREDWNRRATQRSGIDDTHNIKLGDGGIREIEFVVQLNQLIRGGRIPSLQKRSLLGALSQQVSTGVIDETLAKRLESAYVFLRRTEHLLQYREDEQTHLLPHQPELRNDLASAMGLSPGEFEETLAAHRAFVHGTFRNAFRLAGMGDDADQPSQNTRTETASASSSAITINLAAHIEALFGAPNESLVQRIDSLLQGHRVRSLPTTSRRRLKTLLPAVVDAAAKTANPEQTATRLFDLIEQIAQRSPYMALLAEYPEILARVARIVGASPWAAQYLRQYPLLLDSLIEWQSLMAAPDFADLARQMHSELDACLLPSGQPDVEQQMNLMRDTQRQISFQLLAQDLGGVLTVEALADQLSALADMLLAETIQRVWPLVQPKGQAPEALTPPRFAVIAYGRLGGKEIGYASDLDLVFVYDDDTRDDAAEIYAKLGRRMASWLSTMTSSGRLYEIDLRLRPDGDAGVLAVSLDAFEQYQLTHAWPWEHQAISRARFAAGDSKVGDRFEAIREKILLLPRDPASLRDEVKTMRDKMAAGHPNKTDLFDLKHDKGGMVDIEFITQFLVLSQARQYPELVGNLGNIALLGLAARANLIPAGLAAQVADAYREFRKAQHALRLQGHDIARVAQDQFLAEREAVVALWQAVLDA
ncbi:MAG: bifunctional [glutamate--ammonia ligase]-adenylyl-L-tyrosine phosphorylase/[glutamate--ammonia-ligase] adenylyltransferase [Pusillimonas sp.]